MSSVTSSTYGTTGTTNAWTGTWGNTSTSGIDLSSALTDVNNGVDYTTIVNQLSAINQQSVTTLQTQLTTLQAKQTAFQDVQSKVSALESAMATLKDINNLRQASADSSNTAVVVATASKTSEEGSHDVLVNQLAKSERLMQTAGQADLTSTVGAGAFEYTYKGATRTIQTTATTTLQQLVDQINKDGGNPGVTASTLQYNGNYHLVLAAKDTGAGNAITVNDADTTLAGFATAGFPVTQAAQDAQIRVDGFPPAGTDSFNVNAAANWLTRASNTITDVLPGITLNVLSAGESSVTLNRDPSAIATDLQAMVTAYNDLQTTISGYTSYDSTKKTGGVLQGDSRVTGLITQIRGMLGGAIAGFKVKDSSAADPGDTFSFAQQIGLYFGMKLDGTQLVSAVTNDKSGTLSLDTAQLSTALQTDYEGVLALISNGVASGSSDNSRLTFDSAMSKTQSGSYQVKVTYDAGGNVTAAQIRQVGQSTWRTALVSGNNIGGASGNPEEGLSMTASFDSTRGGGYTDTAVVRVSEGFAGQLDDTLTNLLDSTSGHLFTDGNSSYDTQVKSMNDKITARQAVVDKENQDLKDKYARLQATLAQLQEQKAAVENSLKQFETKATS